MKKVYLLFWIASVGFALPQTEGSEMAVLMRSMLNFLKTEKIAIANNKPAQTFPASSKKVEKATITEGKNLSQNHPIMRDSFFLALDSYYAVKEPYERKVAFNTLVSKCITCHEQECPGPIPAIKKQAAP